MVRTKINKHFNKETILWGDMDFLEKVIRTTDIEAVIFKMQSNLDDYKKGNPNDERVKEVEGMITILRDSVSYIHILFNQGESSERYAFEVTKVNLVHQRTIEDLTKENQQLKKNI